MSRVRALAVKGALVSLAGALVLFAPTKPAEAYDCITGCCACTNESCYDLYNGPDGDGICQVVCGSYSAMTACDDNDCDDGSNLVQCLEA